MLAIPEYMLLYLGENRLFALLSNLSGDLATDFSHLFAIGQVLLCYK